VQSRDALPEFKQYATERGHDLAALTGTAAVDLMVGFYRDVRADDCDVEIGADALLFHWGTYDWGDGEHFEFDVARQLFLSGAEPNEAGVIGDADDHLWHLLLTLRLAPTPELRRLGQGDLWCGSPAELEEFDSGIRASVAYAAIASRADAVQIRWECAG
jgi:hypothetical protein